MIAQKRSAELEQNKEAAAEEKKKVKREKTLLNNPMVKSGMRYFLNHGMRALFGILQKKN